ncbi:MAG: hypothetical protein ABMA13_14995 [Chthoniobacteraceae bacterium]
MQTLVLIALAALAAGAVHAAPPTYTVVVFLPHKGPGSTLSFEGRAVGSLPGRAMLEFQLPAGLGGRVRAGRGPGAAVGGWPVFYADVRGQEGETIRLLMDLKIANSYGVGAASTGSGSIYFPMPTQQVSEGRFRRLSPQEAAALTPGLKAIRRGLVKKLATPIPRPTPTRR